jgi:hypothetical protein
LNIRKSSFVGRLGSMVILAVGFIPSTARPASAPAQAVPPVLSPSDGEHLVRVLPVFFVPAGEKEPTPEQGEKWMRHMQWAQKRYREMLGGQDTFALASDRPVVYESKNPLRLYRAAPEGSAPQCLAELLEFFKTDRFDAPYVFFIMVLNPADDFPNGGGRPINGGFNTGGGVIIMSTYALDRIPNVQSTIQHELGHSFGLTHVDAFGYNMATCPSIMSYNKAHHAKDFQPSPTPGILIPEDLRGLALNKKVLPHFTYVPAKSLSPKIPHLGPMTIPGQPSWLATVSTSSGEEFGSSAANAVQHEIKPSSEKTGFDKTTMWQSGKTTTGWVSIDVTFPVPLTLDRLVVHSQHSGKHHEARQVKVQVFEKGAWQARVQRALPSVDAAASFPSVTAQKWRFSFQAGQSGYVVIRGLQFFHAGRELFPPPVPYSEAPAPALKGKR